VAPTGGTSPTAAELFSGGGGLALGLRNAGVRPVVAVELDQYAADVSKPTIRIFSFSGATFGPLLAMI